MGKDSTRAVAKMSLDPADLTHDIVSWGFHNFDTGFHKFATEKTKKNKKKTFQFLHNTVVRLNIGFHQTFFAQT